MKLFLIKNKQHSLLPEQQEMLKLAFPDCKIEFIEVPPEGWDLYEINQMVEKISGKYFPIVFLSPIAPAMLRLQAMGENVWVFFNSHREKKELPNGKVISVVAKTGWQLVRYNSKGEQTALSLNDLVQDSFNDGEDWNQLELNELNEI